MDDRVNIQITPSQAWKGDVILTFASVNGQSTLGSPGKEAGDIRLVESSTTTDGPWKALVSLGPPDKINAETLRKVGAACARWLSKNEISSAAIDPAGLENLPVKDSLTHFMEGLMLGSYRFDKHKSQPSEQKPLMVDILEDQAVKNQQPALNRMEIISEAVNLARTLAHEPPNVINPITLAERARQIADENGLKITVLDENQLAQIGAGALLAVGQGSQTPSRLIVLEYPGDPPQSGERPVALVGKAITFDTGGYSLKDRQGMVGMKYDKSGGADVLAVLQAAAQLKLKVPVIGLVAAAENMVSGNAYRPNDIIKTLSGKTVEIISADAEGRLVLSDALTYAQQHFQPREIIDLATLTGGVVVALGRLRAGILSNNPALTDELMAAGERTHELLWPLPLDDEYFELIKGDDSDFKNSGPREAHPIIGGIFLKQFVSNDIPWAHLDIAGTADTEKDLPYSPKGATGFGVRLLVDYLSRIQ